MATVKIIPVFNLKDETGHNIREFVAKCQADSDLDFNPMPLFNHLLALALEEAFEAGRQFQRDPSKFIE